MPVDDEWTKGFRTLDQDDQAEDRFTRTVAFKSRVSRFKPCIRSFPADQLHTNFLNDEMGPGYYKTPPLPTFSFKLPSHEARFRPSSHSPETEWVKNPELGPGSYESVSCHGDLIQTRGGPAPNVPPGYQFGDVPREVQLAFPTEGNVQALYDPFKNHDKRFWQTAHVPVWQGPKRAAACNPKEFLKSGMGKGAGATPSPNKRRSRSEATERSRKYFANKHYATWRPSPRRPYESENIPPDEHGFFGDFLGPDYRGALGFDSKSCEIGHGRNPYYVSFNASSDRTPDTIMINMVTEPQMKGNTHLGPHFTHESWRPAKKENGDIQQYKKVPPQVKSKEQLKQERQSWWRHELEMTRNELGPTEVNKKDT